MSRRIHKDTGWRLFLRTVLGRAYPRAVGYQRQISSLAVDVALPLLALLAYIFAYRAIGAPQVFLGYVVLGGAMTAFWLNVIWAMAVQFFWERQMGNLALYVMSPSSLMGILLGMSVGGMVVSAPRAAFVILLGSLLFHIPYSITSLPLLISIFLVMLAALYALGMMCASLFLTFGREARYFLDMTQEPVYLISGVYFPIRNLNFWIAAGASVIPLTLGLDAMRQVLFGPAARGFLSPKVEGAILLALALVFLAAARWTLRHMERAAIADGKLTEQRA